MGSRGAVAVAAIVAVIAVAAYYGIPFLISVVNTLLVDAGRLIHEAMGSV